MPDARFVVCLLGQDGRQALGNDGGIDLEEIADTTLRRCTQNDKCLRALDLSGTLFTSLFLSQFTGALCHNTALQEIYLDNCRLGDEGARVLGHGLATRDAQTLKVLSLEDNGVKCRGAAYLAKIFDAPGARWGRTFGGYRALVFGPGRGLRHFSLKRNSVGSVGARAIAEALARSDVSLETLNLEANEIGDWAAGWLATVLRNNNVLQSMNLRSNPIGNDGMEELRNACSTGGATLLVEAASPPHAGGGGAHGQEQVGEVADPGEESAASRGGSESSVRAANPGARLCMVYVTEAALDNTGGKASEATSSAPRCWQPLGAFRPGSASRRQACGTRRHNAALGVEEPAAIMANSAGVGSHQSASSRPSSRPSSACRRSDGSRLGSRPSSACRVGESRSSSRPNSACRRVDSGRVASRPSSASHHGERSCSASRLGSASHHSASMLDSATRDEATSNRGKTPDVGGGAWGPRRPGGAKAPVRTASTYAAGHVPDHAMREPDGAVNPSVVGAATVAAADAANVASSQCVAPMARVPNGERAVGADEKETATALVAPSRWRRKPPDIPEAPSCRAGGSGTAAARRLRRCYSAPGRHRRGMLMGPLAASAMCI